MNCHRASAWPLAALVWLRADAECSLPAPRSRTACDSSCLRAASVFWPLRTVTFTIQAWKESVWKSPERSSWVNVPWLHSVSFSVCPFSHPSLSLICLLAFRETNANLCEEKVIWPQETDYFISVHRMSHQKGPCVLQVSFQFFLLFSHKCSLLAQSGNNADKT